MINNISTKCVICGKDLTADMTQIVLDLKGNSACLIHEGSKELYEWVVRHQKQEIEVLQQENMQLKQENEVLRLEKQSLFGEVLRLSRQEPNYAIKYDNCTEGEV